MFFSWVLSFSLPVSLSKAHLRTHNAWFNNLQCLFHELTAKAFWIQLLQEKFSTEFKPNDVRISKRNLLDFWFFFSILNELSRFIEVTMYVDLCWFSDLMNSFRINFIRFLNKTLDLYKTVSLSSLLVTIKRSVISRAPQLFRVKISIIKLSIQIFKVENVHFLYTLLWSGNNLSLDTYDDKLK